jgi:hypothetical protein
MKENMSKWDFQAHRNVQNVLICDEHTPGEFTPLIDHTIHDIQLPTTQQPDAASFCKHHVHYLFDMLNTLLLQFLPEKPSPTITLIEMQVLNLNFTLLAKLEKFQHKLLKLSADGCTELVVDNETHTDA